MPLFYGRGPPILQILDFAINKKQMAKNKKTNNKIKINKKYIYISLIKEMIF